MMDLDSAIRQKGCYSCAEEHRQLAEWLKELKAYKEQSGDAISREEAVNAIYDLCGENVSLKENPLRDNPHMDAVVDALENLPSVTPQQRTGRWINAKVGKLFPSNDFKCSECGNILDFNGVNCGRGDANYCPNCGAKMEVEE